MKECSFCKKFLSFDYFSKRNDKPMYDDLNPSKYRHLCKQCDSINVKLKFFNISFEEFTNLRIKHNDTCAICGVSEIEARNNKTKHYGLYIDHCHSTNNVRGLLCHHCNLLIGYAKDNPIILQNAIHYLSQEDIV